MGISTLVPQSNQNKYQDSVGISTLVPQSHISMQLESVNMENSVRQTRTRIATQIYTPSKTLPVIQNYRLNVRKAAEKLIDATSRPYDCKIDIKHENIIIEFSAGALLLFMDCFNNHFNTSPQLKLVHTNKFDESQEKLVERSISVALASKPRQQLYRINIYHTTCKIEVNGRHMYQFLDELKVIGEAMKDIPNLKQINDVIRNKCQEFLSKQNVQTAETILAKPANGAKALTDKGHTQCLKCKKQCLTSCIFCTAGKHWIHFHCDKIKKDEIAQVIASPVDKPYLCKICGQNQSRTPTNNNTLQNNSILGNRNILSITHPYSSVKDKPIHNSNNAAIAILDEGIDQRGNEDITQVKDIDNTVNIIQNIVQQPNACTSANVNSSREVITIDQQALTPTTNRTVKDPRSTVNPSNDTEYSNKELRQKEMKLKRKEDEIKKSKAEIEDCSKDNHRLKSYSLKLEAQVKELENSNRILRMKVVGSDDAVQHIKVNTNENMHTVPHCGPKRDENLHYTHQWQQNSDIQYPNNPLIDMNHLTNTAEV